MDVSVDLPPPPTPHDPVGQVSAFVLLNRKCFARPPPAAGTVPGQQKRNTSVVVAVVVQPSKDLQDGRNLVALKTR